MQIHTPCCSLGLRLLPPVRAPSYSGRSVSNPGHQPPSTIAVINSPHRGPIVPQKRYKPHASSDYKLYVEEVEFKPTIYFRDFNDGDLIDGLPIVNIMQNRIRNLQGREDSMLSDCGPSISLRINVSYADNRAIISLC